MIIPRRRKRDSFLPWIQLIVDCVSIQLLLRACFWLRFKSAYFETSLGVLDYPVYHRSFTLVMIILVFFLRFYGLYKPSRLLTFSAEVGRVVKAVVASTIVLTTITFFIRDFTFSRVFLVMVGVLLAAGPAAIAREDPGR